MAGSQNTADRLLEHVTSPFGEINTSADAYRIIQTAVGIAALTLCPIVVLGDHLFGDVTELRGSVSAYYYGFGRNWFVGGLCAMALFFLSYEYNPREGRGIDNVQSTFASVCALTVALAPTGSSENPVGMERAVAIVHGIAAALLLVTMAVFSLYHFTKTCSEELKDLSLKEKLKRFIRTDWERVTRLLLSNGKPAPSKRKRRRNSIYRGFGWVIVASLIGAAVGIKFDVGRLFFWSEVTAVTAFGFSWLVKGDAFGFLNDSDQSPIVETPSKEQRLQAFADVLVDA